MLFVDPWLLRKPAPVNTITPRGLTVTRVKTTEELISFDQASAVGFAVEDTGTAYAAGLVEDDRYCFLLGRSHNEIVSGVLAFNDGGSSGIYTLFTLPAARRRGYASALISSALSRNPEYPATTNASTMSARLFRRMGFTQIGSRTIWIQRPH